jgi:chromosome partitioning protein
LFIGDAQEMYVLALVTQKGGSGKSTLAVGLAVAAMENGERVAFVEADPQGTISKWKERRGNPFPRVVRVADPAEIERALVRLEAEGIWLAIIDTAATNNALATEFYQPTDVTGRHHEGRSLPDPDASESRRHRSCSTDADCYS